MEISNNWASKDVYKIQSATTKERTKDAKTTGEGGRPEKFSPEVSGQIACDGVASKPYQDCNHGADRIGCGLHMGIDLAVLGFLSYEIESFCKNRLRSSEADGRMGSTIPFPEGKTSIN
jgi:hypothetical protein